MRLRPQMASSPSLRECLSHSAKDGGASCAPAQWFGYGRSTSTKTCFAHRWLGSCPTRAESARDYTQTSGMVERSCTMSGCSWASRPRRFSTVGSRSSLILMKAGCAPRNFRTPNKDEDPAAVRHLGHVFPKPQVVGAHQISRSCCACPELYLCSSGGMLILVDCAAESVVSAYVQVGDAVRVGDGCEGRTQRSGLMYPWRGRCSL